MKTQIAPRIPLQSSNEHLHESNLPKSLLVQGDFVGDGATWNSVLMSNIVVKFWVETAIECDKFEFVGEI